MCVRVCVKEREIANERVKVKEYLKTGIHSLSTCRRMQVSSVANQEAASFLKAFGDPVMDPVWKSIREEERDSPRTKETQTIISPNHKKATNK